MLASKIPMLLFNSTAMGTADGPAVRLVSSAENRIQTLVLSVSSLKRAETFLAENGMLGVVKENYLSIAPEKIYGLEVRLVSGDN
jgi:hypothetical protein